MHYKPSSKFNNILYVSLLCVLLITIEFFALVLVATIPQDTIQKNTQQSASFLCEKDVFFYANSSDKSSKIDRYADSILLNIAYYYDNDNPFTSVMESSYYHNPYNNENINLLTAVMDSPSPTLEYSRYWHGSIAIVRPLLILFDIEQIYFLNFVVFILLLLAVLILIAKHIGKAGAICFAVASVTTSLWHVPMSLEYTWTVFIMLIASIVTLNKLHSDDYNFTMLFLVIGSVTAYFDFLTTETLTFLIPAILIITYKHLSDKLLTLRLEIKAFIKHGVAWFVGYLFTWLSKWTLASIILKTNVFADAFSQAKYRAVGETDELSGLSQRIGAQGRNIGDLFPFSLSNNSLIFAIIFFVVVLSIIYFIRKENNTFNHLMIMLAAIPYIRYFILGNHSYLHHFFTFRAQLATVLCLGLIIAYGSDRSLLKKEWNKLWKKKRN